MTNPSPHVPAGWDGTLCAKCASPHVDANGRNTCLAHSKRTGRACLGAPRRGTERCRMHGGVSRAEQIERSTRAVALAEVAKLLSVPPDVDHRQVLTDELGRATVMEAWLRGLVFDIDTPLELVWGKTREVTKLPAPEVTKEARASVWWAMWNEERERLWRLSKLHHDIGMDEHRAKVAAEQTRLLAEVVKGILVDLGVFDDPRTPAVVRRHLAAIETNATSNEGATK